MFISRDYSYISSGENRLIDAGYGKITVHSLHFDRYVSEEQKKKNLAFFGSMTDEQRKEYYKSAEFEAIQVDFANALEEVMLFFNGKFDIHQITPEKSTNEHYGSNWDLFFWSDRGWNNSKYMSHFSLTFNGKRTPEQNMKMLENIIALLESMENEKVSCRIQYDAYIDMEKVAEAARKVFDDIAGKFVEMFGYVGKIKIVSNDAEGVKYGFFQKGAKKKYYAVSGADLVSMNL